MRTLLSPQFCVAVFCVASVIVSSAQNIKTLPLDGTDGSAPWGALVRGLDGNFYGTTSGGAIGSGSVFRLTPSGKLTTIYQFCAHPSCADGSFPTAGLLLAKNGKFYGTTSFGGGGGGTIFELTPGGSLTTIYNFPVQLWTDPQEPYGGLIQGPNGNFYGTTRIGGTYGQGTVFEVTPAGQLTILHSFCAAGPPCPDGQQPEAGLALGPNGNFYGTTIGGGAYGVGAIFEISPSGKLTTIYSFCSQSECNDGSYPYAPLILGRDGNFYGTTYGPGNAGTVFRITAQGVLTTLYFFCSEYGCPDGSNLYGGIVQDSEGNLYGTTEGGGVLFCPPGIGGCGTLFKLTPSAQLITLHTFCTAGYPCVDGMGPVATLFQGTNGVLYGSTAGGGSGGTCTGGCGTLFSLSLGLAPFVQLTPNFGKVGREVIILGNQLTNATSVTFNGTTASFKVISDTYIRAKVPTGATTGTVEVVTAGGVLKSNAPFLVLP
jgi:uncharacterized repeat protein (TIGR03803 family)